MLTKRPERLRRFLADECRCGKGHVPGFTCDPGWTGPARGTARRTFLAWSATRSITNGGGRCLTSGSGRRSNSATTAARADELRQTPAAIRFLSLEPLLGPLPSLDLIRHRLDDSRRGERSRSAPDGSRLGP